MIDVYFTAMIILLLPVYIYSIGQKDNDNLSCQSEGFHATLKWYMTHDITVSVTLMTAIH